MHDSPLNPVAALNRIGAGASSRTNTTGREGPSPPRRYQYFHTSLPPVPRRGESASKSPSTGQGNQELAAGRPSGATALFQDFADRYFPEEARRRRSWMRRDLGWRTRAAEGKKLGELPAAGFGSSFMSAARSRSGDQSSWELERPRGVCWHPFQALKRSAAGIGSRVAPSCWGGGGTWNSHERLGPRCRFGKGRPLPVSDLLSLSWCSERPAWFIATVAAAGGVLRQWSPPGSSPRWFWPITAKSPAGQFGAR